MRIYRFDNPTQKVLCSCLVLAEQCSSCLACRGYFKRGVVLLGVVGVAILAMTNGYIRDRLTHVRHRSSAPCKVLRINSSNPSLQLVRVVSLEKGLGRVYKSFRIFLSHKVTLCLLWWAKNLDLLVASLFSCFLSRIYVSWISHCQPRTGFVWTTAHCGNYFTDYISSIHEYCVYYWRHTADGLFRYRSLVMAERH